MCIRDSLGIIQLILIYVAYQLGMKSILKTNYLIRGLGIIYIPVNIIFSKMLPKHENSNDEVNTNSESLSIQLDDQGELLEEHEVRMIKGVFDLDKKVVREIMVPRSGMVTLPSNVSFSQLMKEVHLSRHARFLVTDKSLDDVLGVLDLRQLADPISKGTMQLDTCLREYVQSVPKVLETCTLDKILPLIKSGNPFLLVVDEHGGTEGLITSADLTGEIVGDEIDSVKDPFLKQIAILPEKWLSAGDLEIIEINRQLFIDLPESNDYHTLAGFLLEKFQQVPAKGDFLLEDGIRFEIISMQGPRIETVKILLPSKASTENL